jgi:P4 family phage/plasmid primase-like protien
MSAPANITPQHWQDLISLGFSVFPVKRGGKEPMGKWKDHHTNAPDPAKVARWVDMQANIGIACGAVSGLVVLDLDTPEAVAEAQRLGIPETITAHTGRGFHVYFRHPGGKIGNRARIFPGADVRGDGGYVVAPPSLHPSGARYKWAHPPGLFDLADPPGWLLDLLAKPGRPNNPPPPRSDRLSAWAEAAIDGVLADLREAPEGQRNNTLNKAAFRLGQIAGAGLICEADAIPHLQATARAIGLDAAEIDATLQSGWRAGLANPRGPKERLTFTTRARIEPETGEVIKDAPESEAKPKARCNSKTSEDQIALAFVRRHGDRLRFDHSAGRWYEWTGTRWQRNETRLAFHFARELARESSDGAKGFCKASVASGVEAFARADPQLAVTAEIWDRDPWLLGTPGGTVDLRTGELRTARREDFITRQTGAAPEPGEPRRWLQFLGEATAGDSELIRFLQQVAGYCLTGSTCEQALFFIYGPGGNGKSVFVNILKHVLGDYAVTASMETFTASRLDRHPTDLAMLKGARLVSASETEEGRAWAESRIKQVTGGDKISARFMRQDFFEFSPQFKLVIVGNHAPMLANVDEAARRRFNIIPFTQKPVTPDRKLEDKLKAEAGQILSWAIEGCLDWQANGLVRPEVVKAATADYFEDQDLFGRWLEDNCERGPSKWETAQTLFRDWQDYAKAAGEDPGTQRAMASKLKRAGFMPRKVTGGARAYHGIALKSKKEFL